MMEAFSLLIPLISVATYAFVKMDTISQWTKNEEKTAKVGFQEKQLTRSGALQRDQKLNSVRDTSKSIVKGNNVIKKSGSIQA